VTTGKGADQQMNMPAHNDLKLAFHEFNQASGVLESAYRELDARVDVLRGELAMTRRQQRERSVEAERLTDRFRLLLSVLPAGVIVLDGGGRVRECNAAARRLIGSRIDGALWRDLVDEIFAARSDAGPDLRLRSGRYVHLETCSLGAEPGQLLLLNDVTERRELESRVEKLRRLSAIGDMAATIAHQIRTPLAAALLYVSGMRSRLAQPDEAGLETARKSCLRITATLRRLEHLVEDLLAFARQGHFEAEVFDPGAALVGYQKTRAALVAQRDGALEVVSGGDPCPIAGNREALASVLDNLVDNALAVGGAGTRITLRLTVTGAEHIEIRVSDNGPGIAPQARQRIFDPFFSSRPEGTGLGLAIARAIIESHGGDIESVDPEDGAGACLRIRLPRIENGGRS